jgi:hypothetical protein
MAEEENGCVEVPKDAGSRRPADPEEYRVTQERHGAGRHGRAPAQQGARNLCRSGLGRALVCVERQIRVAQRLAQLHQAHRVGARA